MKKINNLNILYKNINNKSKLIPTCNERKNDVGNTKYLPPYFKEWKNTIYSYNKNIIKNVSYNNIFINKLIEIYMNLLFINNNKYNNKFVYLKLKKYRRYMKKHIYISKPEIKYNNSSAIITIYSTNMLNSFMHFSLLWEHWINKTTLWGKGFFLWKKKNWNKERKFFSYMKKKPELNEVLLKELFLKKNLKNWSSDLNNDKILNNNSYYINNLLFNNKSYPFNKNLPIPLYLQLNKNSYDINIKYLTWIKYILKTLKEKGITYDYLIKDNSINDSNNKVILINSFKDIIKYKFNNNILSALMFNLYTLEYIKNSYYKELKILYKYKHLYYLTLSKLKTNVKKKNSSLNFIYKLKSILSSILRKKVNFNIINLKSITYNTDIFTKALALRLSRRKINIIKSIKTIINKGNINSKKKDNKIKSLKKKDWTLLDNKYKNHSIISMINNDNINNILKKTYQSNDNKNINIFDLIFSSIKYKNMRGIRLEIKGRLTKRYRADRSIYKLFWKGGLKNIDSSFKGLSSVNLRGYLKPNVNYSMFKSKRRIGAFAVKGWIAGR